MNLKPDWPDTLSPQAQQMIAAINAMPPPDATMPPEQMRTMIEAMQHNLARPQLERYGVTVAGAQMGGVPVRIFTPPPGAGAPLAAGSKVLLNLHGGGFVLDSGSMTENIALCALAGLPVVAVLYRLAPEHPFPAAVGDASW